LIAFFIVLAAAAGVRLYRLNELPLGAFVDEIFTLNSTLLLRERPFDPFGHTLEISQAWGKDHPNLLLYFNLLILKIFGVSYWSTKLLTVIPGVIACGFVYLIARRMFNDRRVALATALLFTFGHWSIRLSRYGWDVCWMIALFAAALWLNSPPQPRRGGAKRRGRPGQENSLLTSTTPAAATASALPSSAEEGSFLAGIAAGLSLYTYLGARIAVFSLLVFLAIECAARRDRLVYRRAAAFVIGLLLAAVPFFIYYVSAPGAFWARTSEVSVFGSPNPVRTILDNIAQHALMFHWRGGTFARDNFPGLPMLDPLTGVLFIAGIIVLAQRRDTPARLLLCTLLVNFTGGVLSVSQEGGPYLYRTAAMIVPAFLISGVGLEWLIQKAGTRWLAMTTAAIIAINLYLYFGLEPKNTAAMRVMAYEPRVIGQQIARQNSPVSLNASDVLTQKEVHAHPGERYPEDNPAVILPPMLRKLAIINFSGRYDMNRSLADNLAHPRDIYFVE
jgi:hypothetical protein